MLKKFLVALPNFRGTKGFCCPTILVSAKDEQDAISLVYSLKGNRVIIGDIKEVNY
jgi:hypothetical protein